MTPDTLFLSAWSQRSDGTYKGASAGGIGIQVKYAIEPEPEHLFCDPARHAGVVLQRSGHLVVRSRYPYDNEPAWQRRDAFCGHEKLHNDADFAEVGHTWATMVNEMEWAR